MTQPTPTCDICGSPLWSLWVGHHPCANCKPKKERKLPEESDDPEQAGYVPEFAREPKP